MSDQQQGNRFTAMDMSRVDGIEPVDGWALFTYDYEDGDGFFSPFYVAVGPDRDVLLNTSRFYFTPTQARFEWIVGQGFPPGVIYASGVRGPLSDRSIDAALEQQGERKALAA